MLNGGGTKPLKICIFGMFHVYVDVHPISQPFHFLLCTQLNGVAFLQLCPLADYMNLGTIKGTFLSIFHLYLSATSNVLYKEQ